MRLLGCMTLESLSFIYIRPEWDILLRRWLLEARIWLSGVPAVEKAEREREFLTVVGRYADIIDRICRSFAFSDDDYSDLRQDTLVNIWKGLNGYRADASLKTWIYRVTLNTCVSTYRKRPKGIVFVDEEKGDVAAAQSSRYDDLQLLNYLLSQLSLEDHSIMTMWLDDMAYDEIASVIGLNRATVGSRISRIRKRLKELAAKV